MDKITSLPRYLVDRYVNWKSGQFSDQREDHARLAAEGQHPNVMVISCCDSRVHVTSIFGAETGEFFIHRNVANLVPPFSDDDLHHGTSAAIEFAVKALQISHLIVLGHSQCGGVRHCHDISHNKFMKGDGGFVDRWMDILRPGYDRVSHIANDAERIRALEHVGVEIAIENLLGFPFIQQAVEENNLTLHGLWHNIADGVLESYDSETGEFSVVA